MDPRNPNSIALLIDADNAPAGKIEFILSELAAHGVVNIRRAYGNWTKSDLGGWIKVLHQQRESHRPSHLWFQETRQFV